MEIVCTLIAYREFESPPLRQISRGYWKTVTPFCFCAIVPPVAVSLHAGLSVATAKGRNHIHSFNTASCRAPNEFLEPTHFFAAQCRRASLFLQHLGWPHAGRMACAHRLLLVAIACYRQNDRKRFALRTVFGTSLAMGLALAIRCSFYNPRPFVLGLGRMLIEHDATTSFPSLHATFLFSLALPLVAQNGARDTAIAVLLLGLAIAWARIFVGVHYPLDMAGAFIIAGIAAVAACAVFKQRTPQ